VPESSYFTPHSFATSHACTSGASTPLWSGNYLNWASMQTLDVFRWALTGGYRTTDAEFGDTILTKTYADNTGSGDITPDKTLKAGISGATPFNWASVTTSIKNRGIALLVTGTNTTVSTATNSPTYGCSKGSTCVATNTTSDYKAQNSYASIGSADLADAKTVYKLYVNVLVCAASSVGVEDNCVAYGSSYKPEGLIQKYSSKLRFAAFGYFNDGNKFRDGGVLRAPMKYTGPTQPVPGSTAITNPAAEWSSVTGVMVTNPDSALATTTTNDSGVTITQSGVMNYLNKFGLVTSGGSRYKSIDPVSELYYTTLRYLRNVGPVPSYSSMAGATAAQKKQWLDGFPVSNDWKDPVVYSCQKNFILGVGDVNAHRDADLPGTSLWSAGEEPTTPSEVTADNKNNGVDVTKSTKMVAQLEGLSASLATSYMPGSRYNTYYMAGLAYDAHTVDQRPDLTGSQTVNTYWVDVMEGQVHVPRNQYWLATKYGGFTVPADFSPYSASNDSTTLSLTDWYTNTDTLTGTDGKVYKRPDNYFAAYQGSTMVSGLSAAFAKISSEANETITTALGAPTRRTSTSGSANYSASYDPKSWTGRLIGSTLTVNGSKTTLTDVWDARSLLQSKTATTRLIVTCCKADGSALPFTSDALSGATLDPRTYYASFAQVPNVDSAKQSASKFVSYLRGDTAQEILKGGAYRNRTFLLGDIVDSKPEIVAAPSFPYYDSFNPGYSVFKEKYKSRSSVVYVGANDGMMHAFDGSVTAASGGTELFAYIPSFTYGDSSAKSDRYFGTYGLASLGDPSYVHHYFVNATPKQFDVDLANAGGDTSKASDWHTVLIGGLGKGGKGYYAIDVTDPSAFTTEAAVAGKVLWEFTDSRMGNTFGDAHMVKTAKYGWVVIVPSGYNNSDGKSYIFIVHPKTGRLLETISTPSGSNLGHIRAFINDYSDYTADSVYGADLEGNLWRFDLTATSGSYPSPTLMAVLKNAAGDALPVTTPPLIAVDPSTKKRYVMVGTGQLLSDSDIASTSLQAFFAIVDGTGDTGGFYEEGELPAGKFPLGRSDLTAVTTFKTAMADTASPLGWYYDLTSGTKSIAERVIIDGDVALGVVAFSANLPNGDPCTPSGSSRDFAVRFATAYSAFRDSAGNLVEYINNSTATTELLFTKSGDGSLSLTRGGSGADITNTAIDTGLSAFKFLNWREISTVD
jgi:type IV pilus assembly protein PilY1